MKKLLSLVLVVGLGFGMTSAMACPKGQTITGGVGSHHKGGKCTARFLGPAAKTASPIAKMTSALKK